MGAVFFLEMYVCVYVFVFGQREYMEAHTLKIWHTFSGKDSLKGQIVTH